MININEKTLQDLEFDTVLEQVSQYCITDLGKKEVLKILPFKSEEILLYELKLTNEYLSSFYNENRINEANLLFVPLGSTTKELPRPL